MVFTVRLIVVIILLLAICASVPAAQRRSYRRSVPKEVDPATITTSPTPNDATNPTISKSQDKSTPESKPKTETSSQKYDDTNAVRKTKSRGNAKYFTTTTEKYATSTPPNARVKSTTTEKLGTTQQTNPETNSNVIETQLQNNADKKTQRVKEIEELPYKEEKPESSKVPRKPHNVVQEQSNDTAESMSSKSARKIEKPHNFVQDETEGGADSKAVPRKPENPHNFIQDTSEDVTTKAPRKLEKPHNFIQDEDHSEPSNSKLEKPDNFVQGEVEGGQTKEESTETVRTTKRGENGRSLSMNIEKFISPEFHNQNNYYTSALFPDIKKSMPFSKDSLKPTVSFEIYAELTTPRNQFFDSKFQAVREDVSESLDGIDRLFRYNQESETAKTAKEDVINNDTKADVDYKKFRHLEASESKTRNRIHKDYVAEKGVHLDVVSNYSDTKVIDDDGISDGLNKIPATGVGVEYKEEGPRKLPDMENQESKKIVAENPYIPIRDVPDKPSNKTETDNAFTNKIETDFTKSTQPILANIDPITAGDSDYEKNLRENVITVFKRGSTKKAEASPTVLPEAVSVQSKPDENRKENAVVSMMKAQATSTEASLVSLEKDVAKENAIVEPSVISDGYDKDERKTKILIEPTRTSLDGTGQKGAPEITTQHSEASSTTLEYPKNNLINVIKRGSTKIAEVDHEYFEGVTMAPITMKPSKLPTVTEEEPNEILPIAVTVSPKKLPPEDPLESAGVTDEVISTEKETEAPSPTEITCTPTSVTEAGSTESPPTTISSDIQSDTTPEEDFTEDLLIATESTEIFNVSVIITESDETSTLPYSSTMTVDDTSYYSVSEEDSTTIMYEVTTGGDSEETIKFESNPDLNNTNAEVPTTSRSASNLTENDIIKQNEVYSDKDGEKVVPLNSSSTTSESVGRDMHDIEDELNPDDADDDYVETTNRKVNQSDVSDLEGETEGANPSMSTQNSTSTITEINNTIINVLSDEDQAETTTVDILGLTGAVEEDNSGKIAAIVISSVGAVCLFLLAGLLIVMRKRQKRFNYGQRCRPVSLDAYSMDNVSICNTVGRRKGVLRTSKRSYGNPAFDDPATVKHPLNFFGLSKFAGNLEDVKAEFEEIPQVTTRTNELPEGCDVKNRYANVIPLPETRVFLNYIDGYPTSDYINANYVRGAKGARHYYIACQAPMQNTIDDFWRMIWEQQSKVILMLTSLFENGIEKCADYLPPSEVLDCHRLFGDFQVTLKKREVKDKYIISNLQLKNMVSNSWREITHLWYLEWPDKGVPEEANSIIAFLIEARSYMKSGGVPDGKIKDAANIMNDSAAFELSPVVVHCSPGTGRTGTVIGCDIAIREFELSRQVDIPKIVYKIRRDRASSVQTKEQYAFIYKVINLYATKLTGGALDSI